MRVAILTGGLPPESTGGSEIAADQIARCASRMGHEMHLIAATSSKSRRLVIRNWGSITDQDFSHYIHYIHTPRTRYIHGLGYIPKAVQEILRVQPNIVHVQGMYTAPAAIIARLAYRIPYLFYERGGVDMDIPSNRVVYPVIMRFADRVIAQTEAQLYSLQKHYRREVEVIPNGVDLDRFRENNKDQDRALLGLPGKVPIVVTVARCRSEKRLDMFVRAAALLKDVTFLLVGDGPELPKLRYMSGSNVIFSGGVDNSQVPFYISSSDILVNTSSSEGFPMSILEGMAGGLPIIAPRMCGIPEIVTDKVNGLLMDPASPENLAEYVSQILGNPEMRGRISQANRQKAREYSWENVVRRLYR